MPIFARAPSSSAGALKQRVKASVTSEPNTPDAHLHREVADKLCQGQIQCEDLIHALTRCFNTESARERWLLAELLQYLFAHYGNNALLQPLLLALPTVVKPALQGSYKERKEGAHADQAKATIIVQRWLDQMVKEHGVYALPPYWRMADPVTGHQIARWALQTTLQPMLESVTELCFEDAKLKAQAAEAVRQNVLNLADPQTALAPFWNFLSSRNDRHRYLAADFLLSLLEECPMHVQPLFPHLTDLLRPVVCASPSDRAGTEDASAKQTAMRILTRFGAPVPLPPREQTPHSSPSSNSSARTGLRPVSTRRSDDATSPNGMYISPGSSEVSRPSAPPAEEQTPLLCRRAALTSELRVLAEQRARVTIAGITVCFVDDYRHGSQALVAFAQDAASSACQYAIKFFWEAHEYSRELALYQEPNVQQLLPGLLGYTVNEEGFALSLDGPAFPPCLILERGQPLSVWIATPRSHHHVRSMLDDVSEMLCVLHGSGWEHRDIKPENVVWLNNSMRWRLLDLGIARRIGEVHWPQCTPTYAPPEVVHAARIADVQHDCARRIRVDPSHDIFALGMMAWEALMNKKAFGTYSDVAAGKAFASLDELLQCAKEERPYPWNGPDMPLALQAKLQDSRLEPQLRWCLYLRPQGRPTAMELRDAIN